MTGIAKDLVFSLRLLRKRPAATVVIVATLGLGIGVNATFFAAFYGMALRPLPFEEPDELVSIWRQHPETGETYRAPSEIDLFQFRDSEALEGLGAYDPTLCNLRADGPPERVPGAAVTVDLFPLLGVAPAQGRAFTPEEGAPGGPRVVLISDDLWRRSFGGEPDFVGRMIQVDGEPAEVVGIMPPGFAFPLNHEIWTPLQLDRASASPTPSGLVFLGRLADGQSVETAESALGVAVAETARQYPDLYRDETAKVRGLHEAWMPPVTQVAAIVMQGLASLVLLIVGANVANMVLAQAMQRRQETALRTALGASRGQLLRQSLVEGTLLAVLGGGFGLLLVLWQGDWMQRVSAVPIPYWLNLKVDGAAVAFSVGISVLTGLGIGLVPGLRSLRGRLVEGLKSGGRSDGGSTASDGRLRQILVVGEYALAVVVLAGALVMVQAYERLQRADTGFAVDHRLTFKLSLPVLDADSRLAALETLERSLDVVRSLPEVKSASATSFLPIENGPYYSAPLEAAGVDFEEGHEPRVTIQAVEPEYFDTMEVDVVDGRGLQAGEFADGAAVALVSRSLAERLWPGEGAVGRQLRPIADDVPWLRIVGVTHDVEPGEPLAGIDRRPADQIYVPISLAGYGDAGFLSRTPAVVLETDAAAVALMPALREALALAEPELPIFDARSMETVLRQHYFAQHIWSRMFAIIAFVALGIAALGAYGVSAYAVNRRVHELGIRLALGARPGRLMAGVIGGGALQAMLGLGLGLALALPMVKGMAGLLHGVDLWDLRVVGGVVALLAFVSLLATYFPARRAAMVDPIVALRQE
ncbi:MAG: ADOP family duplicated permease [Acidobacteriota bacterium]